MPDRFYADEWAPSRFSLGTLRLIAFAISSFLEARRPTSGAYLNRERHQHPLEALILAVAYGLIPTAHLTMLSWRASASILVTIVAFPAFLVAVALLWVLFALLLTPVARVVRRMTGHKTHDIQAHFAAVGMVALAVCSIVLDWPGAFLGWLWAGLTVVEIVASIVCLGLTSRFEALDSRLPSEAP